MAKTKKKTGFVLPSPESVPLLSVLLSYFRNVRGASVITASSLGPQTGPELIKGLSIYGTVVADRAGQQLNDIIPMIRSNAVGVPMCIMPLLLPLTVLLEKYM